MAKSEQLVVKSNQLTEARYEFNIWETRVFTKMVTMIKKDDQEFKRYKIDIKDLIGFFGSVSNNDYDRIKAVPRSLMKKIIEIPYIENGKKRLFMTPLVTSATKPIDDGEDENSYIELTFHPDIKPYLLELKGRFLKYDIGNVLRISSTHSVRIYELLKQYEKIGYRIIEVAELKILLGVQNKYNLYGHFKSRVIAQAQKDLKKNTDIYFEFEEIKESRSVYAIKFLIFTNTTEETTGKKKQKHKGKKQRGTGNLFNLSKEPEHEVVKELINVGIDYEKAIALIEQYGEANVLEELKFAQKELKSKSNVQSKTGFIISMIEKQSYTKKQAFKTAQKESNKKTKAAEDKQRQKQQVKIAGLREEYTKKRNLAVNRFLKGKTKIEIQSIVEECSKEQPFIKKAMKLAEKNKDKNQVNDFKYLLVAKRLEKEALRTFDLYLAIDYNCKIVRDGVGEYLEKL